MANYDGLTKNSWPGTWAPSSKAPIALDTDLRGTLQSISGEVGDRLTDIPGQRLSEGMLVYVKTGYADRASDKHYKYVLLAGESRDFATGNLPNNEANWSLATFTVPVSRGVAQYTTPILQPLEVHDFDVMTGLSCIVNKLTVSVPCTTEAHSVSTRDDSNPFKFISTWDHLTDDGATLLSDNTVIYNRRYTILINNDTPPQPVTHFRITNTGLTATAVVLDITFIPTSE